MTLAFILICFITNMLWFLYFLEMKKENEEFKIIEADLTIKKYVDGRNDEGDLIKKQFTYAKTPEEFCNWVYTYYFTATSESF